jgi:hypothetical protein
VRKRAIPVKQQLPRTHRQPPPDNLPRSPPEGPAHHRQLTTGKFLLLYHLGREAAVRIIDS